MTYEALIRMKHHLSLICFKRRKSCWDKGVNKYADELMEDLIESRRHHEVEDVKSLRSVLMQGADSWLKYSRGGFGLVSCYMIAKRLCNKSEFKKCCEGMFPLNPREDWCKVESRALSQAFELVKQAFNYATKKGE